MSSSVDDPRFTDESGVEADSQKTLNEFSKKTAEDGIPDTEEIGEGEVTPVGSNQNPTESIEKNREADKEEEENWSDARSTLPPTDKADRKGDTKQETSLSTDFTLEETEEGLKIKWTPVETFTKYLPVIDRSDVEESASKETEKHEHFFKTNVYDWKTGEDIAVQLFAIDETGKQHAVTKKLQYIIGGSTAISGLKVDKNSEKPFTGIDLEWCALESKPEFYQIYVFKSEENLLHEEKATKDTKITIDNLTPSTSYYFEVVAVYTDSGVRKPTRSLEIRTGDDPNAQQVKILKDMQMRSLKVKWNNYALGNTSYYIVYLKSDEKSERIGEHRVEKTKNEVYFHKLKSDTDYVAHVITMGTNNEVIAESVSNPVSTHKVQRNSSFDIKIAGKPVINACGADVKNDELVSFLSWSLPDLGDESINFDCIDVEAFITKNGEKKTLEVQNKNRAKAKVLEFGKNYQFDITCTYKDLDSHILQEATTTQTLQTGICQPPEPDVQFANKDIKVSWTPVKGAIKYELTILDEKMEQVKKEPVGKKTSTKFPMAGSYGMGNRCTFVLTASGENGKEEASRKEIIIGGDNAVTDVVTIASRKRSITVTWEPPKNSTNKYMIRLYDAKTKQKLKEQPISAQNQNQCTCTFEDLKAKTSYYCKVFSERSGKLKNGSQSNIVKTSEAKRNPKFNIKSAGKPAIQKCEALLINGKYESRFKWTLPDIGVEKNNFTLKTNAYFMVKSRKEHQLELKNSCKAKPISLEFGETYKFSVKCTYTDLDNDTTCLLEDTRSVDTDIGTPSISDISWEGSDIIIKWQPATGATRHVLSVFDDATNLNVHDKLEIDDYEHILKMSRTCGYGMTCNFVIYAAGRNQKEKQHQKRALIGGNTICTEVNAKKDTDCPRRAVILSWQPPRKPPKGYKVQILETNKKAGAVSDFIELEAIVSSYKFEELKTDTTYVCKVIPLYQDGAIENCTLSNELRTDKKKISGTEKMENFGEPEKIVHRIVGKKPGVVAVEIAWDAVRVGENFKLEKYHIDVYEPGMVWHEYHQRGDYKPKQTNTTKISLNTGKEIRVNFVTTYRDLDTREKKKTRTKQYSFFTQPSTPLLKGCVCEKGIVAFSWEGVDGAQKYNAVLEDLKSNTIESETVHGQKCESKFKLSDKLCFGRTYKFTLTADLNKVKSEPVSRDYLIGGKCAVTDVVLTKDKAVPRRALVLNWNSPERVPESYHVELYQVDMNEKRRIKEVKTEAHIQTHKFTELKTSITYMCKVSPIYQKVTEVGSYSDQIKTDKRLIPDIEATDDYGKPEKIFDNAGSSSRNDSFVELLWSTVNVGENHKIKNFHITVSEHGAQLKPIFDKDLLPESKKVNVEKVKKGHKYEVKFTTVLMDLDNNEQQKKTKSHSFFLRTSDTNVEKCEIKEDGLIILTWNAVEGAEMYHLMVKDEFLSEEILYQEKISDGESLKKKLQVVKVAKSEELRIGRTCMSKVIVHGNGLESESDWKPLLIGGELVPRNVKAKEYAANPERCIQVTFDAAKTGEADEYMVSPIPASKIHKHGQLSRSGSVVVKYLRRGITYKFSVSARHGSKWSKSSLSNSFSTQENIRGTDAPVMEARNVPKAHFDNRYATFKGGTYINTAKGIEFGQVRDLTPLFLAHDGDKDRWKFKWKVPDFGNDASDYKVENYKAEIGLKSATPIITSCLEFVEDEQEYCCEEIPLELGETYEISVSTTYIDIDKDKEYKSSSTKVTVMTRPCKPIVTTNKVEKEELKLVWNHSNGADHYVVNLYVDDLNKYQINTGKKTVYERSFDEDFGFGKRYHVVIDAVGAKGKKSSTKTEEKMIGEDHVPKRVKANITHEKVTDPSTQVYLEWDPPDKTPVSYEVTSKRGGMCNLSPHGKTACVVFGLTAGTDYIFKVIAIHHDMDGKQKRSGGCFSSKIQTSPKPNQVQNVRTEPGLNPCTSVVVEWDKVNVATYDEAIIYRVIVTTLDRKISEETTFATNCKEVHGLQPNTLYFIKVAGGNKEGFGKNSEKLSFKTAEGKPKRVRLINSVKAPSTELILQYTEMEGRRQTYFGILYEGQTLVSGPCEVKSGHKYKKLSANTTYKAEVYVEFQNGEKGASLQSIEAKTAPGKPEITEYGCCSDDGELSSSDLYLKWKTVAEVSCCQIRIIFERNGQTEKEIIVMNENEMKYSCKHEACLYGVQVRAKTEKFGDWSDTKLIDLGPTILENVNVESKNKSDGNVEQENSIIIQCNKNQKQPVKYCMQALCNGIQEGEVKTIMHESVDGDIVKFSYLPQNPGQTYEFDLWAEKNDDLKGKKTRSNTVISRPENVKSIFAAPAEDNPSMKIKVCWDAVERCTAYELLIQRTDPDTRECLARVKSTTLHYEYICSQPECEYTVCLRSLWKSTAGDWSEAATVRLEPPVLQDIVAKLDNNDQSKSIIIQCKKIPGESKYCMQALCNDVSEGPKKNYGLFDGNIVTFRYLPKKSAEIYSFDIWAEINDDLRGKSARSNTVISKPEKVKDVFAEPAKDNPSMKMTIRWNAVDRCDAYELIIQCVDPPTQECLTKVEEIYFEYTCCRPENEYAVRVRGLRECISGEWSIEAKVRLEPPILQNIEAVLDDQGNIKIKCKRNQQNEPLQYRMRALCNGVDEGIEEGEKFVAGDNVEFSYVPQKSAEKYSFQLWAEKPEGLSGKKTFSNTVISRPEKVKTVLLELDNDNPSGKIKIGWNDVKRCDVYEVWVQCSDSKSPECVMRVQNTNCKYVCNNPGEIYTVRIRGLRQNCASDWSENFSTCLAPSKIDSVEVNITANPNIVNVIWKPLAKTPTKYIVALHQDNEKILEEETIATQHAFKDKIRPGCLCYCTVAAENDGGKGKIQSSISHRSVPAKIENLRCERENENIIFEWDAAQPTPDKYLLKWRLNNDSVTEESTEETRIKKRLMKGVESYELSVTALNITGRGRMAKKETLVPVPGMIQNLTSKQKDGGILFKWDPLTPSPDEYLVQWKVNNESINEESTKETKFEIFISKPAHIYNLRVKASNIVGYGAISEWNTFITDPLPPRNMTVIPDKNNPQTSFLVKYEDDIDPLKEYKVTAVAIDGDKELASVTTEKLWALITGLGHGESCHMKVQTSYRGKKSKELFYAGDKP